jgi:hypothetical protein
MGLLTLDNSNFGTNYINFNIDIRAFRLSNFMTTTRTTNKLNIGDFPMVIK